MNQINFLIDKHIPEAIADFAKANPAYSESDLLHLDSEDIAHSMMDLTFDSKLEDIEDTPRDEMLYALTDYIYDHEDKIHDLIINFSKLFKL